MMSRYASSSDAGDGNASSSNRGAEAPLPTYEEVVGAESQQRLHPSGFKSDVLLPPSSTDQGQSDGGAPNRELHEGARRASTCKPNRTGTILVLIGMILIPICGMIIILQIKVCATEHTQLKQSVDKINASYSDCTDELANVQERLDSNENIIRDLKYKVEQLTKQRDIFRIMAYDKSSKIKASANVSKIEKRLRAKEEDRYI